MYVWQIPSDSKLQKPKGTDSRHAVGQHQRLPGCCANVERFTSRNKFETVVRGSVIVVAWHRLSRRRRRMPT